MHLRARLTFPASNRRWIAVDVQMDSIATYRNWKSTTLSGQFQVGKLATLSELRGELATIVFKAPSPGRLQDHAATGVSSRATNPDRGYRY
jgi:hypothetical protein